MVVVNEELQYIHVPKAVVVAIDGVKASLLLGQAPKCLHIVRFVQKLTENRRLRVVVKRRATLDESPEEIVVRSDGHVEIIREHQQVLQVVTYCYVVIEVRCEKKHSVPGGIIYWIIVTEIYISH